jgi:hypothetical protein
VSPTEVAEQRIMAPILRRLASRAEQLQSRLVRAHAQGVPVPALNRTVAREIGAMRQAARLTAARSPVPLSELTPVLAWRVDRVKAVTRVIKAEEAPSLGVLLGLVAQVRGLGSDLERHVSDTLVTQHTQKQDRECGPDEVLIFEPERNACVRCLKYAGMYRESGEEFRAGLSFDPDAPKPKGKIPGPPIHPHCRCNLTRIPRSLAPSNSDALRREAERSILKGWALPSESNSVRTAAAKELLSSGINAPKSVIAEARKRLKSGATFTRDVP